MKNTIKWNDIKFVSVIISKLGDVETETKRIHFYDGRTIEKVTKRNTNPWGL